MHSHRRCETGIPVTSRKQRGISVQPTHSQLFLLISRSLQNPPARRMCASVPSRHSATKISAVVCTPFDGADLERRFKGQQFWGIVQQTATMPFSYRAARRSRRSTNNALVRQLSTLSSILWHPLIRSTIPWRRGLAPRQSGHPSS